jgi:hypothetical protein
LNQSAGKQQISPFPGPDIPNLPPCLPASPTQNPKYLVRRQGLRVALRYRCGPIPIRLREGRADALLRLAGLGPGPKSPIRIRSSVRHVTGHSFLAKRFHRRPVRTVREDLGLFSRCNPVFQAKKGKSETTAPNGFAARLVYRSFGQLRKQASNSSPDAWWNVSSVDQDPEISRPWMILSCSSITTCGLGDELINGGS